mgnify:CR=1 FL=1
MYKRQEYDWLKDLVEIIEKNENPEHSYEYTKLQMFQENVFCFTPKGSVIKLPKEATAIDFAYAVHTKIGNSATGCEINGNKSDLQTILHNGDRVNIITSKNNSPSLHWIPTTKTGKARAAIRRYWHEKGERKEERVKKYNTTLWISLPDFPGKLGEVTSLIGDNKGNIIGVEMAEKKANHINFLFDIQIDDLKNFTKLISELKQKEFNINPNIRKLKSDYPIDDSKSPISIANFNAVGGSTILYSGHFPRFHPSDFKVKTLDGVADDWPMTYQELEPYYDLNDNMHGVSGLKGDPAYPPKPTRPTPPLALGHSGEVLARGFNKLGWHWWPSDNAIPSVEYDGNSPDHGGYLRSMTSSDIVYWPKALRRGVQLKTYSRVREILVDKSGKASGAIYYDKNGDLQIQKARVVVMAANGVGTSRIPVSYTHLTLPTNREV